MKQSYPQTNDLTYEQAHTLFTYKDGHLYWKVDRRNCSRGSLAGSREPKGYWRIGYEGKSYKAHRVIWVMHGNHPVPVLDHIDGDRLNNKIENLRAASFGENNLNSKLQKRNTYGVKGLRWFAGRNKWIGVIRHKGKQYYTKGFSSEDKDECIRALKALREFLHGDFARHN
jgi:hypothetical protein